MAMGIEQKDTVRFLANIITAFCGVVLVPLNAWALNKLVHQGERLTAIETWMGEGSRYTDADAAKDVGILAKILEAQGKEIDDHESRIREIEKSRP